MHRPDRLSELLVGRWTWCLTAVVLLTALGWSSALRLAFDQSIESLYADDNPRLIDFRDSKQTFGGDEFVVLAYRDPQLFATPETLTEAAQDRQDRLRDKLRALSGIDPATVQTLADALRAPYARHRIRELVTGLLLGADGETTAIVSRLLPEQQSPIPRAETFRQIRAVAASHDPPAVVVGEPIQVHDMFRYVEDDGFTLGWWSSLLLMGVIFLFFRSLRWMVLPLLVVQVSLVWTKAILVLSRMQLSMVSSMLNSLTTIIGIATVMHVTLRFRAWRTSLDREAAVQQTFRDLSLPIIWTILTTAAGFLALMTSRITPIASFGLMMALSTGMVLVVVALLLPGGMLLGARTSIPATAPGEAWIVGRLTRLATLVERRPTLTGTFMCGLAAICTVGLFRLEIETDFSKNFRAHSPLVLALDFFETHLGGAGTWEVNFPAPEKLTEEYLERVGQLADELRVLEQRPGTDRLTKVIVLNDGLDLIPSRLLFARLSLDTRLGLLNAVQPDFAYGLYNPEAGRMRIMLRALERQPSADKLRLIGEVEAAASRHFPGARATGLFVLLTYLIESLMNDQVTSSLMAAAAIFTLMALAQRSLAMGGALLIPNLFPIVLVIGAMGWSGMKVNIATAMIASVSMGLTIDSSIHYLAGYRRHRAEGRSLTEALQATHEETGLALVYANVALVAGFSVLTLSHFIPLVYFGVLVSVAMIGGLIGNLVLLPLLIRFLDPRQTSDP